jgi:hypothetical protein
VRRIAQKLSEEAAWLDKGPVEMGGYIGVTTGCVVDRLQQGAVRGVERDQPGDHLRSCLQR